MDGARLDFCNECKEKTYHEICRSCKTIYQKHFRAKKKIQSEMGHIQKNPELYEVICLDCNLKKIKDFCQDCSRSYINYRKRKKYHSKSKSEIDEQKRKRNEYYQMSIKPKTRTAKKSGRSKRTVNRKINKVLNIIDTPKGETSVKVLKGVIQKSKENVKKALNFEQQKPEQQKPEVEIAAEIFEQQKQILHVKPKSEKNYQLGNSYKNVMKDQSLRTIAKSLKVGRNKAKDIRSGLAKRKPSTNCISSTQKTKIIEFYKQDDVSRIDANMGTTTKKWGPRRYMKMKLQDAHRKFEREHNETIGFSTFASLRPVNVRSFTKIPHEVCLCVYCDNIRNKIDVLNSCTPGAHNNNPRNVYELYYCLICHREEGKLPNVKCIERTCEECEDWESKVRDLYRNVDPTKCVQWLRWEKMEYTTSKNETRTRREPVKKIQPVQVCIQELIEDIIKPTKYITFIRHFFNQIYQNKQYKYNLKHLEVGECLIVQDFSKNRQIVHQDEIKSQYFAKKSVTMHPSVCFVKLSQQEPPKRIVISHLSDIKDHDAHMVNHITKDTIKILRDVFQIELTRIYIWSDGCSSQYKGKYSFNYLSFMKNIERHFFGSEHGKGKKVNFILY